jgi:ribonuclease HI
VEFKDWRCAQHKHILLFDGALKGNPGAAGGGGVLYGPDEILELVYSWGLGEDTNNMAEALSLWQGLTQARELGINEISVIGDSRLLIQALVTNSLPNQMKLRQLLKKIQRLSKSFRRLIFSMFSGI